MDFEDKAIVVEADVCRGPRMNIDTITNKYKGRYR